MWVRRAARRRPRAGCGRSCREGKGLAALAAYLSYTLRVADIDSHTLRSIIAPLGPHAEEAVMTGAERLIQEGLLRGRQEGRQEGRRHTLEKLIRLRFGEPDGATSRRLESATEEQLEAWTERILTAPSLEELLA